jgi:hypothetical protein
VDHRVDRAEIDWANRSERAERYVTIASHEDRALVAGQNRRPVIDLSIPFTNGPESAGSRKTTYERWSGVERSPNAGVGRGGVRSLEWGGAESERWSGVERSPM